MQFLLSREDDLKKKEFIELVNKFKKAQYIIGWDNNEEIYNK